MIDTKSHKDFEQLKFELQRAFAAPDNTYLRITLDDIINRNLVAKRRPNES